MKIKAPKSTVIGVPIDQIKKVEKMLGKKNIAAKQIPIIKVRVPVAMVKQIRRVLRNAGREKR